MNDASKNGKVGSDVRVAAENGRLGIKLHEHKEVLAVKAENLSARNPTKNESREGADLPSECWAAAVSTRVADSQSSPQ